MPSLIPRGARESFAARLAGALPVAVALAVGGCSSSLQVHTDYDPTANFSAAKTYSWRTGTPLANPLQGQRVVNAVDAQLRAKGLTRVDSGGDLSVTYHGATDKSVDIQSFSTGSPYSCWGGCQTSTTVTPVTVGTLIVDIVDTRSNKLLWRGSGTDTVSGDPSENARKIDEAVYRMFENFPPKP